MGVSESLFASDKDDWGTPPWLFELLDAEFSFDVDVAADAENTKCADYFGEAEDSLTQNWRGVCFLNPPFSQVSAFMYKAMFEARSARAVVVALVAARTDTAWWWGTARYGEVRFIQNRIKFVGAAHGAPFPSAVVIFRPGLKKRQSFRYWIDATLERKKWEARQLSRATEQGREWKPK